MHSCRTDLSHSYRVTEHKHVSTLPGSRDNNKSNRTERSKNRSNTKNMITCEDQIEKYIHSHGSTEHNLDVTSHISEVKAEAVDTGWGDDFVPMLTNPPSQWMFSTYTEQSSRRTFQFICSNHAYLILDWTKTSSHLGAYPSPSCTVLGPVFGGPW